MSDDVATVILLVGGDAALLEGLVQSLAARGYATVVAASLPEARESAASKAPLVAVIDRDLATSAPANALGIALAPGGALVLFHRRTGEAAMLAPPLQRALLADLALPLERHRLMALVQHVEDRARATGRRPPDGAPRQQIRQ